MEVGERSLPVNINPKNFLAKLWRLSNNPTKKSIFWDTEGEAIVINPHLFEREILTPGPHALGNADTFKTTNFPSFIRQLNLYGFKRVDPANEDINEAAAHLSTCCHFFNPHFKRSNAQQIFASHPMLEEQMAE